ncbi:hypothetical protein CPG37_10860 [Malaciobacter canalis]|uniref:Helicase ATP-binding domain-containing protein n=1 Tax=Malaciobacter canalis TaxID=1912871 RepID=A0ABX4LMJ9_9BACT|nr:DEAD/DEAH box helicase family protein [Malaciobacter canalis]PHO09090.1 hypothetical protein CPG37_10860 [Malaciobacter canalis]QEE31806.1 type III restriction/modification system, restriction subunit [Malaciobacter canalis]
MYDLDYLFKEFETKKTKKDLEKLRKEYEDINPFFLSQLNQSLSLRPYQLEAISRLDYVIENDDVYFEDKSKHILFNMATGSGKTLLMASNILYFYEKGYRNFIFFVNRDVIVKKTKENFVNIQSDKYLFRDEIIHNSQKIKVKEVTSFEETNDDEIQIIFTTIQNLHLKLNTPTENQITYDGVKDLKIVLLSDEAHHLQTATVKSEIEQLEEEENGWESTVSKLLKLNRDNILLEYTATIDLDNENIAKKYEDKIIVRYSLKEFREDKYSKDISLLKSDMSKDKRVLSALLLSYYREKVALDNGMNLKPLILIKSSKIKDSQSDMEDFLDLIKNLTVSDIEYFKDYDNPQIQRAITYFEKDEDFTYENLISIFKSNFVDESIRIINNKSVNESIVRELNELENNSIRVIFAVNMLNEGWDVLNLFDIVRLDETNSSKKDTVISDKQLIGRGCRIFPFNVVGRERFQRKFDEDLTNDLRVLEEFYYHSKNNDKFINSLKDNLVKEGLIDTDEIEIDVKLKDDFKETDFYNDEFVFKNYQIKKDKTKVDFFDDYGVEKRYEFEIDIKKIITDNPFLETESYNFGDVESKKITISKRVYLKSLSLNSFFFFNNLKKYLPIESIDKFIDDYISQISIYLNNIPKSFDLTSLQPKELLEISNNLFKDIEKQMKKRYTDDIGSKEFERKPIKDIFKDFRRKFKQLPSDTDGEGHSIEKHSKRVSIKDENWYVYDNCYGTSEEKYLVGFVNELIKEYQSNTDKEFEYFYLVRNEGVLKTFGFKNGKGFETDFLIFFKHSNSDLKYQLFVEPKGCHLIQNDKWKETDFLNEVQSVFDTNNKIVYETENYRLVGLPFYNNSDCDGNDDKKTKEVFENMIKEIING